MTQVEQVLEYIREHGSITQRQAAADLGIMRLASRVSDLKRLGYPILSETVVVKARNGRSTYVKRYMLP